MKYIVVMMMLFGLAACQNEEKTEAPVAMVEKHEPVSTQAVKKDDITPAVVQKNVEKTSQAVVSTLSEGKAVVNPCSVKPAVKTNANAGAAMANPCSAKTAMNANTDAAKTMANPCSAKVAMNANAGAAKTMANPCSAKAAVNANVGAATKAMAPVPTSAYAEFNTQKCKACHAIDKKKVGPSWKNVVAAYGDEAALADVFKSGFAVGDRKLIASNAKWKGKAGMMTSQYKKMIKKNPEGAAHALFETVKNRKFGKY